MAWKVDDRRSKGIGHFVIVFRWSQAGRRGSYPEFSGLPPNRDIEDPGDVDRRQGGCTNYNRPARGLAAS